MKKIIIYLIIPYIFSCGNNQKINNDAQQIKTIKQDSVSKGSISYDLMGLSLKTLSNYDIENLEEVSIKDAYLKKIREFSSSAILYHYSTINTTNTNYKTLIYLLDQEASYRSLNLVNLSHDNLYIDSAEIMLSGGDGTEFFESNSVFLSEKILLNTFISGIYKENNIPLIKQLCNLKFEIMESGKIKKDTIYNKIGNGTNW